MKLKIIRITDTCDEHDEYYGVIESSFPDSLDGSFKLLYVGESEEECIKWASEQKPEVIEKDDSLNPNN